MKILIIANALTGLIGFRTELIQRLQQEGHTISVIVPADNKCDVSVLGKVDFRFVPMERRGTNPLKDIKLYFQYKKIIKELKPDLVITYTIKCNIYGGCAARMTRTPYVANVTGLGTAFQGDGLLKKLVSFMNKFALKKAKTVFFENQGNLETFVSLDIIKESQAVKLNGAGVNLDKFSYVEPVDNGITDFIFIARIMKEKGIDELIYATNKLIADEIPFSLKILGGMEDNYKDVIDEFCKNEQVEYVGFVNDVRPYIVASDVSVLPSYHEGMSNTLLESAAMGRPLITSDIPGCREAVIDGVSGFLCEKQNAESLYECMKKFAELSFEEKKEMGKQSRKVVEDNFDKNEVVKRTIEGIMK